MSGKAKSHALAALDRSIAEHRKVLKKARKKARMTRPHGKRRDGSDLTEALPGTLAHDQTRRAAGAHLIESSLKQHIRTKGSGCRTFLATFAWDEGIIPADQKDLPNLKPLIHKVYKALKESGLSGVIVIDFALFDPDDGPPYIHIHIHVICWTYDLDFRPKVVAKKLRKRRAFKNSRFKSVDIRSRKEAANLFPFKDNHHFAYVFAKLSRDQTKSSIAWLGQYLWAAPAVTKRVVTDAKTGKRRIVNLASSDNAEGLHLQAEALMKQLSIYDCIAGVEAGCAIRREWKKQMGAWMTRHPSPGYGGTFNHRPRFSGERQAKAKRKRRQLSLLASALQSVRRRGYYKRKS